MNRETRDKFAAMTPQEDLLYGPSACIETPPDLFQVLHKEFHFDVDLFANERNRLLPDWFGPGSSVPDALLTSWGRMGVYKAGFANPPYGAFVGPALRKAIEAAHDGFTSVFLLPMRCGKWYTDLVLPYYSDLRHIPRVKFWYNREPKLTLNGKTGKLEHMQALFDSIVVVYRPIPKGQIGIPFGPRPRYWDWRKEKGTVK